MVRILRYPLIYLNGDPYSIGLLISILKRQDMIDQLIVRQGRRFVLSRLANVFEEWKEQERSVTRKEDNLWTVGKPTASFWVYDHHKKFPERWREWFTLTEDGSRVGNLRSLNAEEDLAIFFGEVIIWFDDYVNAGIRSGMTNEQIALVIFKNIKDQTNGVLSNLELVDGLIVEILISRQRVDPRPRAVFLTMIRNG